MRGTTFTTASVLKAILCFIDAEKTPKIAFDNTELAVPLADKIKRALGDKDGSESVAISFSEEEVELSRQFIGVCANIQTVFSHFSK